MDLDDAEAHNMFEAICEDQNVAFAENLKFPMAEYLDELKIDHDDHEGVEQFVEHLKKARENVAAHADGRPGTSGDKATIRQMFDKLVRHMDWQKIPAKDAWKYADKVRCG